jgi:pimeloyl-ACP methyl ester carboxylesterase
MYILYFQEPGKAERELDADPKKTMRMMLYSASGSVPREEKWNLDLPKSSGFLTGMKEPAKLPGWLAQADLDYYAGEFARRGFRGGLNWYRNFDRNWELLAPWADAKVTVPALFVGGLRDGVVTGPGGEGEGPMVQMLPTFCTDLRGKVLIEGAGHWNQQEAPAATNEALLGFLAGLSRA